MSCIVDLPIEKITQDADIQIRATSIDWLIVDAYLEAARQGATFPPVIVFFDGDNYWLADGNHRLEVARRNARTEISADVRQGCKRDAILYAVGANDDHGLRRTNADKRNAVEKLLKDKEWATWSDREIGRRCKVDHVFVGKLRPINITGDITSEKKERKYKTKHGTVATMNTAAIGKPAEPKPEPPQAALFTQPAEDKQPEREQPKTPVSVETQITEQPLPAWAEGFDQDTEPVIEDEEIAAIVTPQVEPEAEQVVEPEPVKPTYTVNVINADSQYLSSLDMEPVQLVVTSPPYNVGINYENSIDDLLTYIPFVTEVWRQCYKVMADGARIAVVVPFGVGRNPYVPFDCQIMNTLVDAGFQLRGRIVWDKNTTGNRTSWGSFRLSSDPSIRDTTECIIVAHKGQSKLELPSEAKLKDEKGTYTEWLADVDEFMSMAQDHWVIAPESAQRIRHPAPFPVELAKRLIRFYAYPGAHVLDPFGGSGTVGVAAQELGCNATLIEISQQYCELAKGRLGQ